MNTLIRLFDLDPESGQYNDYVYTQWELPLGAPTPRVGEFIYIDPNTTELARVESVTYAYAENSNFIMIDCNVSLFGQEDNDD